MKLNRNFVQISLTALITSAVFVIPMAYSGTGLFNAKFAPTTRIVQWTDVISMHSEYYHHKPLRVQYTNENRDVVKRNLEGFTFDADSLREILEDNASGKRPDKVFFAFGQEGEFPDGFLNHSGNIRLTAVGLLDSNILNYNGTSGTKISVFDKADPCPPMCPKRWEEQE